MPGDWNTRPPWSTEQFLKEVLEKHGKVSGFAQDSEDPQIWRVERLGMDPVEFYFEDVYTLGLADYAAIRQAHPSIRCIVATGDWRNFSNEAAQSAAEDGVALFRIRGLLGALNKDGEQFYAHRPRD